MLTDSQRVRLKEASRVKPGYKEGDVDFNTSNRRLEIVIAELKSESPHSFITTDTRILRRFFYEPLGNIPHQSYVYSKQGLK
jgi:hypothetical protein